ncbi:MAG: Ldh family oxidoreductase [Armatimonadota bacterium]|nr:Ldh family oxidoreductase [Armatimonadota bacterium]
MADLGPFPLGPLTDLIERLFLACGLEAREAAVVARHVVDAEARGSRSQGLIRVGPYAGWARSGRVPPGAPLTVERDGGAVLVLDAHAGWGHPAALRAMELCIERASRTGVCLAAVRRMGHIGRLGYYVEHAARQGAIGLIACGGSSTTGSVAPWGGVAPIFGTNPIAIGFPRDDGPPVVVDVSTTQAARGTVMLAQKTGEPLPDGWAFDADGRPTRDPLRALPPHGTLAPLGGHKGYALALAIEILCGVLPGLWPPEASGNVVGAIHIEAFLPREAYGHALGELAARVKRGPTRPGVDEILLPGEGSARRAAASAARGVTVAKEVWAEIHDLASELGVRHPLLETAPGAARP